MIDLTVKTLDSQNHAFSVEDDTTVAQFKEKIAEIISIPVDSQRLIYCGRVLQDNKKLQEYDVNGKVVHLVQRAPPSTSRRTRSPPPSGNTSRRQFPPGNAMYLGSMAFPSGLMVAQGIVQPPPVQSLSGSRICVARRMLRRAENVLNALEGGTRARESPPEEPQDEVTPVFAAQVIVPSINNDPLASISAAISTVENGILQVEQTLQAVQSIDSDSTDNAASNSTSSPETAAASTTETTENATETAAETETGTPSQEGPRSRVRGLPRNSFGTMDMSRLLDDLNRIHERLRPFMDRYHTFMRTDPTFSNEGEARDTQQVITRVSEIMHLLGHAYHSLSDVMVQANAPAPRPLLCRPILIQQSAVVQAGIPIQVEAQINLTSDRTATPGPQGADIQFTDPEFVNTSPNAATTPPNNTGSAPQPSMTTSQVRPNVHEIRIDTFPFELSGFQRPPVFNISSPRGQTQSGPANNATQATNQGQGEGVGAEPGVEQPPTGNNESDTTSNAQEPVPPFGSNPNMEFFMEVTPGSITIDSLETTVVTSAAQADNVLRGTFAGVPPELFHTLLQQAVASSMMGAASAASSGAQGSTAAPSTDSTTTSTSETASTAAPAATVTATAGAANASNVNSQARGNTQTHPTTATQTRSTSRPHEHLAQHAMQGFDPFLPCNSHHIHRRRVQVGGATIVSAGGGPAGNAATETTPPPEQQNNNQATFLNILQGLIRTLGHNVNFASQPPRAEAQETASATTASQSAATPSAPPPPLDPEQLSNLLNFSDFSRMFLGNTASTQNLPLATFLQNFPDHEHTEGESLFTDLALHVARVLTFGDVIALNAGHLDPLVRIRPMLRTFFRQRILGGNCSSQTAIDRGTTRLIEEMQPIFQIMRRTMSVRDNIDLVESMTQLCRARFPQIISLLMSRMPNCPGSVRGLVDECLLTLRQLCALVLNICEDGQTGVEGIFREIIARYTMGISPDVYQWTVATSVTQLRQFMSTLNVSSESIELFIRGQSAQTTTSQSSSGSQTPAEESEAMECEEAPVVEASAEPPSVLQLEDDSEPLPNVVIGSENWHRGLSADWIPLIARDNQRQRRQGAQPPFSDAYLSGMPNKRRKIVAAQKPQGSLSQVISEGVRRAVQTTGLANAVSLDVVGQAASSDVALQAAYRDLLRSSVQSGLQSNPDFNSDRFPNAANYFNVDK